MVSPVVRDIKTANNILRKATANGTYNGLHFRKLAFPIRLLSITDASHVSKSTLHAQEAKMVLLTTDPGVRHHSEWVNSSEVTVHSGYGHPLYNTARKATRVSHSTSHGEGLGVLAGAQMHN